MKKSALIVVDVQNDFLPGGALAVEKGDEIIPLINRLVTLPFDKIVASMDWHPAKHCSFASKWNKKHGDQVVIDGIEQMLWPDHCVQDTPGAAIASLLDTSSVDLVIHKGIDVVVDSYSAFFDNEKLRSTHLEEFLQREGITDLYIAGLATDYCVYYSSLDALDLGFRVHIILDACRSIGDTTEIIRELQSKGAKIVHTEEVIQWLKALKKNSNG